MPAFTFEKITPPAKLETGGPISPAVRRGALARFVDRLILKRMKTTEDDARKAEEPNTKKSK